LVELVGSSGFCHANFWTFEFGLFRVHIEKIVFEIQNFWPGLSQVFWLGQFYQIHPLRKLVEAIFQSPPP